MTTGVRAIRVTKGGRVVTGLSTSRPARRGRIGTRRHADRGLRAGRTAIRSGGRPGTTARVKTGLTRRSIRVRGFGDVVTRTAPRVSRGVRVSFPRFAGFALPDQTLFPPYYRSARTWTGGPLAEPAVKGGPTIEQGSILRSTIRGGRTNEKGSPLRGRIAGGKTVEKGSRFRSRIATGKTVEQGSRWGSRIGNWRFSGYADPMRPRGIDYFRGRRR